MCPLARDQCPLAVLRLATGLSTLRDSARQGKATAISTSSGNHTWLLQLLYYRTTVMQICLHT